MQWIPEQIVGIGLQRYTSMVKVFKESHEKDVERLAADSRHETESKEGHETNETEHDLRY